MLTIFEAVTSAHHHLGPIVFSFNKAVGNTVIKKGQNLFPPPSKDGNGFFQQITGAGFHQRYPGIQLFCCPLFGRRCIPIT
ncbi:hypothetical protein KDA_47490 [Dictyobacter alpinus]|uniref:Uncharacterized protein n=1 Tax=Dictyobacter alpinus TaxID=2014873 RepID=A0A402BD30_9CHLR|nr:hypothetical protein KDA_47490 [Dictyobacter alpinus]